MKRKISLTVCVIVLCSLLLVGTVKAGNAAYGIIEMPSVTTAVVDGKWTSTDEWTDTVRVDMSGNGSGAFGYNIQDFTNLGLEWIVEFYTDNTNNTGDYWQILIDSPNAGGAAPNSGDYKIEITGHTTLKLYQGNGAGWTEVAPAAGELTWANTMAASPWNSNPHWILEIVDSSKTAGTLQTGQPPNGLGVTAFDASTSKYIAWAPNARANVPDSWGVIADYSTTNTAPEGITFVAILISSSVAMLGAFYYLRKQPKSKST